MLDEERTMFVEARKQIRYRNEDDYRFDANIYQQLFFALGAAVMEQLEGEQ